MPEEPLHVPIVFDPMHLCVHECHTDDVHSLMHDGYASLSDAVRLGWPCRFQPPPPGHPPFSQVTLALCPVLLDIPPPTELVAYVHDASRTQGTATPAVHSQC